MQTFFILFLIFLIFSTITCQKKAVVKNDDVKSTPKPNPDSKNELKGVNSTKSSNSTTNSTSRSIGGPIKMPKGRSLRRTDEILPSVYETQAFGIPQTTHTGPYPFGHDRSPYVGGVDNEYHPHSHGDPYGDPARHGQVYGHGQSGWYDNHRNDESRDRDKNYGDPYDSGSGYGQNGWDRNNYGTNNGNNGWDRERNNNGNTGWDRDRNNNGNTGWGNNNNGNTGWGNSGNTGWGNTGWNNNGWDQMGWSQNPQNIQNSQRNHNPAKYYDTTGKGNPRNTAVYNYGCERDIYFGDQKWILQGRDYCQNLECKYMGPKKENSTVINGVCNSVRVSNSTVGYHDFDVTYNIHCRCPEIGHTGLPMCERKVQIFFHLVPKKTYLDCVNNFDYCGEGKYCMMSSQQATCPTSCKIETDTFWGTTTIRTNYDCCVLV